jgi:hypothetical protein
VCGEPRPPHAAYCIYRAFKGSTARAEALEAVARYVRKHAHLYVRTGARIHSQGKRTAHELLILTVAGEIEELAALAVSNRVTYRDFQLKLERSTSSVSLPIWVWRPKSRGCSASPSGDAVAPNLREAARQGHLA